MRYTVVMIGALVLGVAWMVGAAAWLGVRVNFLNFIALPITFGIGVDYGINMYRRCRLEGPAGIGRAVRGRWRAGPVLVDHGDRLRRAPPR